MDGPYPVLQAVSILAIALTVLLYSIYSLAQSAFTTDIPKIKGIPELPNSIPFFGHLKSLGSVHASAFEDFYRTQGHEVIQAKLGNRRVPDASATIEWPLFYTFHGIVSKTQGGTIGTPPWGESTKRMRTTAGALMTSPAIQRSAPMLDVETKALVGGLGNEIDPRIYFQRLALNLTLIWCCGTRIESVQDPLLHEILRVAHSVSSFRSTNKNIQDYDSVAAGKETTCISAGLLNEAKTEPEKSKLTESEIKSINVSFVSGGFETLATSGLACLAYLSTAQGQEIQEKAHADILAHHGSAKTAWTECLLSEKSPPYVVALSTNHDKAAYGSDADVFAPERWLELENNTLKPGPIYQYYFGAGSRMCPAVAISNRVLYATYVRLLVHFRVMASEEMPPVVGYFGFNEDTAGQGSLRFPRGIR
ncbi:cytochrome P450 [Aspergillus venezuelensis]